MQNKIVFALAVIVVAVVVSPRVRSLAAQAPAKPLVHTYPTGTATDVPKTEVDAVLKRTLSQPVSDQNIRTVDVDGVYQVEVGVVHRNKMQQTGDQVGAGALEHLLITEVYQIVSGGGTFVTGGALDNAAEVAPDSELATTLTGRSSRGRLRPGTGRSRHVGPGDVIILPPKTSHVFTEVDDSGVVYTVLRVDPHHVLPKDYVNTALHP